MKTLLPKLTSEETAMLWRCINNAIKLRAIPAIEWNRANFLSRARNAFKRNLAEPGDCKGDLAMLAALSVAEAQCGRSAGWIPVVQRAAVEIISRPGF